MDSPHSHRAFARLALATTAATYLLILVGVLVRASGAGLGCPDWPHCYGQWIPPTSVEGLPAGYDPAEFNAVLTWTEYLNRLLGVSVGFLILGTLVAAIRHHRHRPRILWPTVGAAVLVAYQGWLGGQVVKSGLESWIITAHLVFALVIVTLLLYATFQWYRPEHPAPVDARHRKLVRLGSMVVGLLLLQIALGTQVRAGIETVLKAQPDLPRAEWLSQVVGIDYAHRGFAQVVLLAIVALALWVRRSFRGDVALQRTNAAVVALLALQIAMGLVLGYAGVPAVAQVLHLSAASLLLGGLVLLVLFAQHPHPQKP